MGKRQLNSLCGIGAWNILAHRRAWCEPQQRGKRSGRRDGVTSVAERERGDMGLWDSPRYQFNEIRPVVR